MPTVKQLHVTKLDAARRQLETAITLYFSHGDPVSLHTLTAAAYNVLRDLNNKRGGPPMFAKDGFLQRIKPGHEADVRRILNAAENFFKHADRDHNETFAFNPDSSEIMLVDACGTYYKLSGEAPPLFRLYQTWYIANYPTHFQLDPEYSERLREMAPEQLRLGRASFFKEMLPLITSISHGGQGGR